ncbi:MAG: hypothetical protein AAFN93_14770 [Bacteroidota bacterium]
MLGWGDLGGMYEIYRSFTYNSDHRLTHVDIYYGNGAQKAAWDADGAKWQAELAANRKRSREETLDFLQSGLDYAGVIPGVGEVFDGVNGLIYLARGDAGNAALSFAAMVPVLGAAALAVKTAKRSKKVVGLGLHDELGVFRRTEAVTYLRAGWQKAGLTKIDWGRASADDYYFKESFREAVGNADEIWFTLRNFDPKYHKPGVTQYELDYIKRNPDLLKKTKFID